jgi:hypothetical protein
MATSVSDNDIEMLRRAILESPALFPLNAESSGESIQFVRLSEADYETVSFLDSRMLRPDLARGIVAWGDLHEIAKSLIPNCHFVFHISHAGSTLMSRLLGLHPAIFAVREPWILRQFALGMFPDRIGTFLGLFSRTFHREQMAVVKATSFVNEIAVQLMNLSANSRAILMYVPLATFLPALLDGAMSDIDSSAAMRLQRMHRHGFLQDVSVASLSPGERVAMSWLSEMWTLTRVASHFPDRTLWVDFDCFLNDQENVLRGVFEHYGIEANVGSMLAGPTMQRYAKKVEASYDSSRRTQLLDQGRARCAQEIARGLAWLGRGEPLEITRSLGLYEV